MVLGAAGMLGRRLVERLARDGTLGIAPIQQVTLADIVEPEKPSSSAFDIETVVADLAVPDAADDCCRAVQTSSFTSLRWFRGRLRLTSSVAIVSISTA